MRLILCQEHLKFEKPPQVPDDTFMFCCFEDFSVGSLKDWDSPAQFKKHRSDFWNKTSLLDMPDGSKSDYFVWFQASPKYDLVDLRQSGVAINDLPVVYEFDDLASEASNIEIWHDQTVRGHVFLWYLIAAFEHRRVERACVSRCFFPDGMQEKLPMAFWSDMLWNTPARGIPARPIGCAQWQLFSNYWKAATKLPAPVDQALVRNADEHTLNALSVLKQRHPGAETGLTNLQTRLLNSAKSDWLKMARVIADAMLAGWDENDRVGDSILQAELEEMSRFTPPLIEINGSGAMRFCEVRSTRYGESMRSI